MAGFSAKQFDTPDETRTPDKSKMEVLDLGSVKAARLTAEPGWRWSECIKPIAGTESCQAHHVGTATVRPEDRHEAEDGSRKRHQARADALQPRLHDCVAGEDRALRHPPAR